MSAAVNGPAVAHTDECRTRLEKAMEDDAVAGGAERLREVRSKRQAVVSASVASGSGGPGQDGPASAAPGASAPVAAAAAAPPDVPMAVGGARWQ